MNKLVIIGNGFDLAHGLKTKYEDFLLWEINDAFKQKSKIIESPFFTIESTNSSIHKPNGDSFQFETIEEFLRFLDDHKKGLVIFLITFKHNFFEHLIKFSSKNWVDIEREYYRQLVNLQASTAYNSERKLNVLKELNAAMELIKVELKRYLSVKDILSFNVNEEIKLHFLEINNRNEIDLTNSTLILNFNYTNIVEKYIPNPSVKINFIHGELNNSKNPLIFGYGDESDEYYEKIEKLNQNEYLKHMKSFAYLQSSNYKSLFEFLDKKNTKFDVFIMGHSCGLSDRLLFTHIFEHQNFNSVKIYYYHKPDRTNDFFERTQEISRYFRLDAKHKMRKVLVPFNESVPLVKYKSNLQN